jgi:hypothetical protein
VSKRSQSWHLYNSLSLSLSLSLSIDAQCQSGLFVWKTSIISEILVHLASRSISFVTSPKKLTNFSFFPISASSISYIPFVYFFNKQHWTTFLLHPLPFKHTLSCPYFPFFFPSTPQPSQFQPESMPECPEKGKKYNLIISLSLSLSVQFFLLPIFK